jgi:hypothetical protein
MEAGTSSPPSPPNSPVADVLSRVYFDGLPFSDAAAQAKVDRVTARRYVDRQVSEIQFAVLQDMVWTTTAVGHRGT